MRTKTIPALATLLGLVPVLAVLAAPQETDDDYTFFDTLDVEVVNVEVVVTDADGQPVRGLTRDDFELLEDGTPVEITNFYSIETETPRSPVGETTLPAAAPEAPRPPDQDLHLGIFVDGMKLEPVNRRQVFDAVSEFFNVDGVRPASLVLATFDGNLNVTSLPEADVGELDRHLATLAESATRGGLAEMERRGLLSQLDNALLDPQVAASEAQSMLSAIQIFAERQYNEARLSTRALESFVEAMAGLPGRKALLYVSGGLTRNPGEALFYAWENKFGNYARGLGVNVTAEARALNTTPELLRLSRHANANRVTFYTIGAGRGGRAGGSVSAEEGGFDLRAMGSASGGRNWTAGLDSIDAANQSGSLQELAAATGGLSMTNSRNYGRLFEDMNRDLTNYYSLGYMPGRERDGENHRIKVRVRGADLQVRHREHYRERTRDEIMNGRTRSAALLGARENPLAVAMEFGNYSSDKPDQYLVPVMVKVPLGNLVLVPQDEVHVGRIGIFICARDGKGRTSPVQSIDVPIRIPNDKLLTALGQVAGYRMVLQMRGEEHEVAVGVRDELGRVESTVTDRWQPAPPVG